MKKFVIATSAMVVATSFPAQSADIFGPPVIAPPPIVEDYPEDIESNDVATGWYLRGDIGYSDNTIDGASYLTSGGPASFKTTDLKGSLSVGGGIGYQVSSTARVDLTLDYDAETDFTGSTVGGPCEISVNGNPTTFYAPNCYSKDVASYTAWTLLANAYVDVFTYGRVTGYVGAGLGGTYIDWNTLANTECVMDGGSEHCSSAMNHAGESGWRFTGALMAGATINMNCAMDADVGYRYRYISGGNMFGYNSTGGTGAGEHKAIHSHGGRVGLRYKIGGCSEATPTYEPPVYK